MYKTKLIGHVAVDSGQVMVVDPCYIRELWRGNSFISDPNEDGSYTPTNELSYDGCCTATLSKERAGQAGFAVASSSGYGDGEYPVYAEYNDEGQIERLTIEFISDDNEENRYDY